MAKVITSNKVQSEVDKAHDYVRTHILFPAGMTGLITMVVGVVGLLVQLWNGTYSWETFTTSSGLLVVGVLVGLGQTKYHQFLLREFPAFFASRMKTATQRSVQKARKASAESPVVHRGRGLIPLWYVLGMGLFIGLSIMTVLAGFLDPVPAFSLPWAGYFWAKMFFWKGIILPPGKKAKKGKV